MNFVVLVKGAVDEAELRVDDAGHPLTRGAAIKVSNFDRIGMEEALRQREGHGGTVTALSLGATESRRALKDAMAMGGDRAVLVVSDPSSAPPDVLGTAYYLSKAIQGMTGVDLVICSEGSSDTYQGQVGAMLAEFLGLPFLAYARRIDCDEGRSVSCEQAFEGFTLVSKASLPAVISMVNGANEPRFPTLLQVMAAAKKPVDEIQVSSLRGQDFPETGVDVLGATVQSSDRKMVVFEGEPEVAARKLVGALRAEGVL